ncbi:MAG: hypothetical protein MHPSP_002404 [Paramarteilia canceri]
MNRLNVARCILFFILFNSYLHVKSSFIDKSKKIPKPGSECKMDIHENRKLLSFTNGYPFDAECTDGFVVCTMVFGKYVWAYGLSSDLKPGLIHHSKAHREIYEGMSFMQKACSRKNGYALWCRANDIYLGTNICSFNDIIPSESCNEKVVHNCGTMVDLLDVEELYEWMNVEPDEFNEMSKYMLPNFFIGLLDVFSDENRVPGINHDLLKVEKIESNQK